jgi:hypothetical protein
MPPPVPLSGSALSTNLPELPSTPHRAALSEPPQPKVESVATPAGDNTAGASEMFFELGKFRDKRRAEITNEELAQLGFRTNVVERARLFRNSYYVVVGPYVHDAEADSAHQTLRSHGYNALPVERGSHSLVLRRGLSLNEKEIPAGDYTIAWESYPTHTKVKFMLGDDVVLTAEGSWADSNVVHKNNAIVYRNNGDGSQNLLQILFAGMKRALVLGNS